MKNYLSEDDFDLFKLVRKKSILFSIVFLFIEFTISANVKSKYEKKSNSEFTDFNVLIADYVQIEIPVKDHWNDFDMLEVGNDMSYVEDKSHFAMWCMMAFPLIAGNDLRKMSKETLAILTNKELIAVNQDKLGIQGFKHTAEDGLETWVKPLSDGNWAITFLNRSDSEKQINFDWKNNSIKDTDFGYEADFANSIYKIKDLWKNKEFGTTKKTFKAKIQSHDVITLKLIK